MARNDFTSIPRPQSPASGTGTKKYQYFRHPSHYYQGGDVAIVIQTEVFRVYSGLLAAQSTVLASKISRRQISTIGGAASGSKVNRSIETMDGVPVFSLSVEDPDHFSLVLDFIYPKQVTQNRIKLMKPTSIIGILRIAHKYQMDGIFQWAKEELETVLPSTPADVHLLSAYNPEIAIQVICEFPSFDLTEYIPFAFYYLATLDLHSLFRLFSKTPLPLEDERRIGKGRDALVKLVIREALDYDEDQHLPFSLAECAFHPLEELSRTRAEPGSATDRLLHRIISELPNIFELTNQ